MIFFVLIIMPLTIDYETTLTLNLRSQIVEDIIITSPQTTTMPGKHTKMKNPRPRRPGNKQMNESNMDLRASARTRGARALSSYNAVETEKPNSPIIHNTRSGGNPHHRDSYNAVETEKQNSPNIHSNRSGGKPRHRASYNAVEKEPNSPNIHSNRSGGKPRHRASYKAVEKEPNSSNIHSNRSGGKPRHRASASPRSSYKAVEKEPNSSNIHSNRSGEKPHNQASARDTRHARHNQRHKKAMMQKKTYHFKPTSRWTVQKQLYEFLRYYGLKTHGNALDFVQYSNLSDCFAEFLKLKIERTGKHSPYQIGDNGIGGAKTLYYAMYYYISRPKEEAKATVGNEFNAPFDIDELMPYIRNTGSFHSSHVKHIIRCVLLAMSENLGWFIANYDTIIHNSHVYREIPHKEFRDMCEAPGVQSSVLTTGFLTRNSVLLTIMAEKIVAERGTFIIPPYTTAILKHLFRTGSNLKTIPGGLRNIGPLVAALRSQLAKTLKPEYSHCKNSKCPLTTIIPDDELKNLNSDDFKAKDIRHLRRSLHDRQHRRQTHRHKNSRPTADGKATVEEKLRDVLRFYEVPGFAKPDVVESMIYELSELKILKPSTIEFIRWSVSNPALSYGLDVYLILQLDDLDIENPEDCRTEYMQLASFSTFGFTPEPRKKKKKKKRGGQREEKSEEKREEKRGEKREEKRGEKREEKRGEKREGKMGNPRFYWRPDRDIWWILKEYFNRYKDNIISGSASSNLPQTITNWLSSNVGDWDYIHPTDQERIEYEVYIWRLFLKGLGSIFDTSITRNAAYKAHVPVSGVTWSVMLNRVARVLRRDLVVPHSTNSLNPQDISLEESKNDVVTTKFVTYSKHRESCKYCLEYYDVRQQAASTKSVWDGGVTFRDLYLLYQQIQENVHGNKKFEIHEYIKVINPAVWDKVKGKRYRTYGYKTLPPSIRDIYTKHSWLLRQLRLVMCRYTNIGIELFTLMNRPIRHLVEKMGREGRNRADIDIEIKNISHNSRMGILTYNIYRGMKRRNRAVLFKPNGAIRDVETPHSWTFRLLLAVLTLPPSHPLFRHIMGDKIIYTLTHKIRHKYNRQHEAFFRQYNIRWFKHLKDKISLYIYIVQCNSKVTVTPTPFFRKCLKDMKSNRSVSKFLSETVSLEPPTNNLGRWLDRFFVKAFDI
jgi:hypothetical protein